MAVDAEQAGLIERDSELAALDAAIEEVVGGDGAFVLIEGAAGIGKSRLLEAVRERAAGRLRELGARGSELERDFAFGVARQLFERELAEMTAPQRRAALSGSAALARAPLGLGHEADPRALSNVSFPPVHGLYWLVSNLATDQPLLLEVDDAHWADAPSLRFLLYLVARLEGVPVLVLAATRPSEPGVDFELVRRLALESAASVIRPDPFSDSGVSTLIERRLGRSPEPAFSTACHSSTGGNPFFLVELLGALSADGVEPTAEAAKSISQASPGTVSQSLLLRLGRLPGSATTVARGIAVLGDAVEPDLVTELAGASEEETAASIDALAAIEILTPGPRPSFVHPVVRESVYLDIPALERSELHARAATLLRQRSAAPTALAPHLMATSPRRDPAAVRTLRDAAYEALGRGAPEIAERYLARALDEPPADADLADVLAELGMSEWLSARDPDGAQRHLDESLSQTADPAIRAARAILLARTIFWTTDAVGACDVLERELARGGHGLDEHARLEAEYCTVGMVHPATVKSAAERVGGLDDIDETTTTGLLQLASLAPRDWLSGSAEQATDTSLRAIHGGRLLEVEGCDSVAIYQVAWALASADHLEAATETIEATLADARERGSIFGLACSLGLRGIIAYRGGDIRSAEADTRSGGALPSVPFAVPTLFGYLALALIESGALEDAEQAVHKSGAGPDLPPLVQMNVANYALGRLRIAQGALEDGIDHLRELGERQDRQTNRNPMLPWRAAAVEALARLGDHAEAARLAEEELAIAKHWGTPSATGIAMRAQGLALGSAGVDALRQSVANLERSPSRLELAHSLFALGSMLRRGGERVEARDHLTVALELARRCGATALVERAHDELVTAGARPRRLMFSGAESLTASERRVAEMAAGGETNRAIAETLYVTPKTVENHLTRVYTKLGVGSRTALPEALAAPAD